MIRGLSDIVVISGVDHVLLDENGMLPSVDRDMIRLFCGRGGRFTLATHRTPESVRGALGELALSLPAVCCCGSLIYDFTENKAAASHPLDAAAAGLLADMLQHIPHLGASVTDEAGRTHVVQMNAAAAACCRREKLACVLQPPEDAVFPWLSLRFYGDAHAIGAVLRQLQTAEQAGPFPFVSCRPDRNSVEIVAAGCGTAAGLAEMRCACRIPPENFYAVGGSTFDLGVMAAAGMAAAVGDAPSAVKLAAGCEASTAAAQGAVAELLYGLMRQYGGTEPYSISDRR